MTLCQPFIHYFSFPFQAFLFSFTKEQMKNSIKVTWCPPFCSLYAYFPSFLFTGQTYSICIPSISPPRLP